MDFGNLLHTGTDLWNSFTRKDVNGNSTATDLLSLIGAGYGAYKGNQQQNQGKQIIENADPFAQYRPQYGAQLAALMADPSSLENDPGYKFELDQGTTNLERSLGSKGYLGSGNMAAEIQKYGQDLARTHYNEKVAQLSHLGGADITPASAGTGANIYDQGLNTVASSLGEAGYTAGRQPGGLVGQVGAAADLASKGSDLWSAGSSVLGGGGVAPLGSAASLGSIAAAAPAAFSLPTTLAGASLLGGGAGLGASAAGAGSIFGTGMGVGASSFAGGSTAVGGLGSTGFGGGAAAASGASGVGSAVLSAVPWVAGAIAVGAVVANNMKKSSPLNDAFDPSTVSFTKGAHFDNTKFTAQELQGYFGPAMKVFNDTGDIYQALAMIPKPSNAKEQIMLKGGVKSLFGGTGNPMRQVAKIKGYTGGPWEAGNDAKKDLIKQVSSPTSDIWNASTTNGYPGWSDTQPVPQVPRMVA